MIKQEIIDNAPDGATHYEIDGDEIYYYAKDTIGRWCCNDGFGSFWPLHSDDFDKLNEILKPL